MMLQPRKFKFKNKQKNRSVLKWRTSSLNYGDCGLRVLRPVRISAKRIFRLKVFLKRAVKKSDLTKRRASELTYSPTCLELKKLKGFECRKGAGKLKDLICKLNWRVFFTRVPKFTSGRARYFFQPVITKLTVPTSIVLRDTRSSHCYAGSPYEMYLSP